MKILNILTKEIMFEDNFKTLRETIENAINLGLKLRGAYLRGAYLRGACLEGADLKDAYLRGADLEGADLEGADLEGADLKYADLEDAYLSGAENIKSFQCGEYNRVSYAVKHENKTMFQIGCFWGDANEAIEKVKEKYGEDSDYEKLIRTYDAIMMKKK